METSLLELAGQGALAQKLHELSGEARAALERDIETQDFTMLRELFEQNQARKPVEVEREILPMPFPHSEHDLRREMWEAAGKNLLKKGAVAAFTLAGGQGSRLGFDGPKGAFEFGLPSKTSLFGLQAKRLLRLSSEAERPIPWCIMTSPLNHAETLAHFEENGYFGLDRKFVRFFDQGTICALAPNGAAIVTKENRLALVPDGNGGCFRALASSGSLAWLQENGVKYIFMNNIDNALVKICDPVFMGALADSGKEAMAKVVSKRDSSEKVGIFAYVNGKPSVVEYTDMPEKLRELKNEEGNLVFDGANIGIYAFRLDALKKMQRTPLPWHAARKTVEGVQASWKFEQFLFDAFQALKTFGTFGAWREDEFAPIKNASGSDSPESARIFLGRLHRYWLIEAGAKLTGESLYEISPTLSYAGEGLSDQIFRRELGKNILEFQP